MYVSCKLHSAVIQPLPSILPSCNQIIVKIQRSIPNDLSNKVRWRESYMHHYQNLQRNTPTHRNSQNLNLHEIKLELNRTYELIQEGIGSVLSFTLLEEPTGI